CGRNVLLRVALRLRGADVREYGRGAQCSAPRPEVLGTVRKSRQLLQILVYVGRLHVSPRTVGVLISKQSPAGNFQQRSDETRKTSAHHGLAMPDRSLSNEVEDDRVAVHADV